MTKYDILENLKKLIGEELDYTEIVSAFGNYQENGKSEVFIEESSNTGYDYIAYINTKDSTEFLFKVEDDIIIDVWIA